MSDNKKWQLHPKVRVSKDSIGRVGTLAAGTGGGLLWGWRDWDDEWDDVGDDDGYVRDDAGDGHNANMVGMLRLWLGAEEAGFHKSISSKNLNLNKGCCKK